LIFCARELKLKSTVNEYVIEQRKHQRFALHLPLELVAGDRTRSEAETENVSSCGVLFRSPVPLDLGDPIEYYITLPRVAGSKVDVRVRCVGKVVRTQTGTSCAATLERYEFVRKRS
jgi:hypothetical protein